MVEEAALWQHERCERLALLVQPQLEVAGHAVQLHEDARRRRDAPQDVHRRRERVFRPLHMPVQVREVGDQTRSLVVWRLWHEKRRAAPLRRRLPRGLDDLAVKQFL